MQKDRSTPWQQIVRLGLFLALIVGPLVFHLTGCARAKTATASESVGKEAKPAQTLDAKALIQERCIQCHGTFRIKAVRFLPNPAAPLVDRMIKHGAKLNDQERAAVIEYLAW